MRGLGRDRTLPAHNRVKPIADRPLKQQSQVPLPPDVQDLIGEIWQAVQADEAHALPPQHREILYRTLWPTLDLSGRRRDVILRKGDLNPTPEEIQFGELAILSARHVLPIWDAFATPGIKSGKGMGQEIRLPRWILDTARDVLREKIEPLKAYDQLGDFFDLVSETSHLVPYPVWCVANSAYAALNVILGSPCFPISVDEGTGYEIMGDEDPALYAASACAISDDNTPGWWSDAEHALPLGFHAENTLGFWEWWLGMAVHGAWQK
jgi:hypothetical protein